MRASKRQTFDSLKQRSGTGELLESIVFEIEPRRRRRGMVNQEMIKSQRKTLQRLNKFLRFEKSFQMTHLPEAGDDEDE